MHILEIVYSTDIVVKKTSLDWTTSHFIRLADRLSLSNNQTTALIYSTIKTGGGDLNDFSILESTMRQKSMVCSSPKVISNIHGYIYWETTAIWCSTLGWKDGKGRCNGRKSWLCSSLVLREEGKLLPSVTPGAYHKLMHLLRCLQYETRQTR